MIKQRNRRGFTLVELLVVVVIIGILAGIVLRLHTLVGERAARAQTLTRIENIKMCLEEYYRQLGAYPPEAGRRVAGQLGTAPIDHGTECEGFDHVAREPIDKFWWDKTQTYPDYVRSDHTGLVYYLVSSTNIVMSDYYRKQPARWKEYMDAGVGWNSWHNIMGGTSHGSQEYTNHIYKLHDGWDRQFVYICGEDNDYQTYKLYSKGPDGKAFDDPRGSSKQREEWGIDDIGRVGMGE